MSVILVPTDFSENAQRALDQALLLADRTGSELELLHIVEMTQIDAPYFSMQTLPKSKRADVLMNNLVNKRINELTLERNPVFRTSVSMSETISGAIVEKFKEVNAKMVIMGKKGAGNWVDKLFGSNTASMIGKTAVPVLSVPAVWEPQHVELFSVCLLPGQLEDYEKQLIEWGEWMKCKLEVVHFSSDKKLEGSRSSAIPVKVVATAENEDVSSRIADYASEMQHGILGMIVQDRNFIEKVFVSSISKQVIKQIPVPLLAMPSSNISGEAS